MSWVWIEDRCECYSRGHDYFWVMNSDNVDKTYESENTGFCMIYWYNCTCKKCGRKFEYAFEN